MFAIHQLEYRFAGQPPLVFADWTAAAGEHWLLTGASGSGKTTLLHGLAGLLRPTHGHIRVADTDLYALPGGRADRFRGQHIGLVLQKPHLLDTLTVEENLQLARYLANLPPDPARIATALAALQLTDKARARPATLSVGQAQRVAIARAVLCQPQLLLADEPTASLDDRNAAAVLQLLQQQATDCQATLVVATHDQRVKQHFSKQYALTPAPTPKSPEGDFLTQ